jgi:hypothetical protein
MNMIKEINSSLILFRKFRVHLLNFVGEFIENDWCGEMSTQKSNVASKNKPKNETPKATPTKISKEETKDNFEEELAWCIDQLGFF